MDFLPAKQSPPTIAQTRKRSLSPPPTPPIKQNKRKEELIKSFSSSVSILWVLLLENKGFEGAFESNKEESFKSS